VNIEIGPLGGVAHRTKVCSDLLGPLGGQLQGIALNRDPAQRAA
jgi:hypothetical protein